jgi:hypothetical protein
MDVSDQLKYGKNSVLLKSGVTMSTEYKLNGFSEISVSAPNNPDAILNIVVKTNNGMELFGPLPLVNLNVIDFSSLYILKENELEVEIEICASSEGKSIKSNHKY